MSSKKRFRDVKQKKSVAVGDKSQNNSNSKLKYASIGLKSKAFLTDMFMLVMPIMYIVFYIVMDGREDFRTHMIQGWLYILIPNFIVVFLFFWKSGQTPGSKAYNIKLVDSKSGEKPHALLIILRYYIELFTIFTLLGLFIAFFREDKKALHDLLSGTTLVVVDV